MTDDAFQTLIDKGSPPKRGAQPARGGLLADEFWRVIEPKLVDRLNTCNARLEIYWQKPTHKTIAPDGGINVSRGQEGEADKLDAARVEAELKCKRDFLEKFETGKIHLWGLPFPAWGGKLEKIPPTLAPVIRLNIQNSTVWDTVLGEVPEKEDPLWRAVRVFAPEVVPPSAALNAAATPPVEAAECDHNSDTSPGDVQKTDSPARHHASKKAVLEFLQSRPGGWKDKDNRVAESDDWDALKREFPDCHNVTREGLRKIREENKVFSMPGRPRKNPAD